MISNAKAPAISISRWDRDNAVLADTGKWNTISSQIGAPVVVSGSRVRGNYVFTGTGDPINFRF